MRRIIATVSLLVCVAVAVGAPRGLLLAAVVAGIGIARSFYAQPRRRTTWNRDS